VAEGAGGATGRVTLFGAVGPIPGDLTSVGDVGSTRTDRYCPQTGPSRFADDKATAAPPSEEAERWKVKGPVTAGRRRYSSSFAGRKRSNQ